jgi:hypothetical protein
MVIGRIFLSYAREDQEKVEKLYQNLSSEGFKPWMDRKDIYGGEEWRFSIQKAIRDSDFFLVCLSSSSVGKRGFLQVEIKKALDIWQEKLVGDIYLIPVRLEDCEVPELLRDFQWVDLFEEGGWARLVKAIKVGMERKSKGTGPIIQEHSSSIASSESANSQVVRKSSGFYFGTDYERGILQLRELLNKGPLDIRNEFHVLEARLLENLKNERLYGSDEAARVDRSRVIDSLNRLMARAGFESSFVDLCQ